MHEVTTKPMTILLPQYTTTYLHNVWEKPANLSRLWAHIGIRPKRSRCREDHKEEQADDVGHGLAQDDAVKRMPWGKDVAKQHRASKDEVEHEVAEAEVLADKVVGKRVGAW